MRLKHRSVAALVYVGAAVALLLLIAILNLIADTSGDSCSSGGPVGQEIEDPACEEILP